MKLNKYIYSIFRLLVLVTLTGTLTSCLFDELFQFQEVPQYDPDEVITLTMQSDKMLPHQVTTRAYDPKSEAEKVIKHMHIFYFDEEGNLLQPFVDQNTRKERFFPYVETDLTMIKVDRYAILQSNVKTSQNKDSSLPTTRTVTICVLANMDDIITSKNSAKLPLINGEVVTLSALESLTYTHPSDESDGAALLSLPKTGMPMIGKQSLVLQDGMTLNNLSIELTALMARVDITINLDAPAYESNLPKLTMQNWKVSNVPLQTSIKAPVYSGTYHTTLDSNTKKTATVVSNQIIYNRNGTVSISFYMFENVQQKVEDSVGDYPTDEAYKQKHKPHLANDNATYVTIDALYTTYDHLADYESTFDVKYKLYLGANHTDDFKVKRNYQYKNNITIVGLTMNDYAGVDGTIPETTFDARVNVTESNPYFISMLNERTMDAHIGVLPMDVYFFRPNTKDATQKMVVSVTDSWVRMEKITSAEMRDGTVLNTACSAVGGGYTAGHGTRKYFTTDLLGQLSSKVTLDASRDRVYFYIDENLASEDREAVITFDYYENDEKINTEKRVISQTHLLPVYFERSGEGSGTIYMEAIEEYLDDCDPLNSFDSDQVYDGLPWAPDGEIGKVDGTEAFANNIKGLDFTTYIITNHNDGKWPKTYVQVNEDANAFEYCYNRNKRGDANGNVTNVKWFLPGITQMEAAITTYYNNFPEFQTNFYWSSAAGKIYKEGPLGIKYGDDQSTDHARSTKIDNVEEGTFFNSQRTQKCNVWGTVQSTTDDPGFKPRSEPLRIRAFRTDLTPVN